MGEMTEQEIINSQAFKLLNHMIDQKVGYVTKMLPWVKNEMERLYAPENGGYNGYVTSRTYQEGDIKVDLPVNLHYLDKLADYIKEIVQTDRQINDLNRQKLRLLNDYDFTHGDDTEQKKIFG
jgi:hypothetical protein